MTTRADARMRAQAGGRATSQRARSRRMEIVRLLADGPRTVGQLSQALDLEYAKVGYHVSALLKRGEVIAIGMVCDWPDATGNPHAKVVALPGTPLLARRGPAPVVRVVRRTQRVDPERVAGWRTIGRGLSGWGGWGNWR